MHGSCTGRRPIGPPGCGARTGSEPELELQVDQDPGGISPLQQMVASGAVVTSLFLTPLDMVKVRLQSQRPLVASKLTTPSRFWSLSYTKSPSAL